MLRRLRSGRVALAARAAIAIALALGLFAGAAAAESPRNASPPTITGTPAVGGTLTAHNGSWLYLDGSACGPECSYTFQWQRCDASGATCEPLEGATGATYTPVAADVGSTLIVRVRAANLVGSAWAQSAPTAPVLSATLGTAPEGSPLDAAQPPDDVDDLLGAPTPALASVVAGSTSCEACLLATSIP